MSEEVAAVEVVANQQTAPEVVVMNTISENPVEEKPEVSEAKKDEAPLSYQQLLEKATTPKPEVVADKLDPVKRLVETLNPEAVAEVAKNDPEAAELLKTLSEKVQAGATQKAESTATLVAEAVKEEASTPKAKKSKKAKEAKMQASATTEGKKTKKTKTSAKTATKGPKASEKDGADVMNSWAQKGPVKKLDFGDLNEKERLTLKGLTGIASEIPPKTIKELAAEIYPDQEPAKANSWVRNALRRLVRSKFVEKVERGAYRPSQKGLNKIVDNALKAGAGN